MTRTILPILQHTPEKVFAAGEDIMVEGGRRDALFILIEGKIQVLRDDVEVARESSPGAVFGEMSLLLDAPHSATVRALSESRFHVLEQPMEFLKAHPEAHLFVSRLLARRLNQVTAYLVDIKRQYANSENHLGMVDQVLESLMHRHPKEAKRPVITED